MRLLGVSTFLMLSLLSPSHAEAGVDVLVRWDFVSTETHPEPMQHANANDLRFTMEGGRVVTSSRGQRAVTRYGQAASIRNGEREHANISYRIRDGRVVATIIFPGSQVFVTVATDGVRSCSADVVYARREGQPLFWGKDRAGVRHFFSDQHADDVRCEIVDQL